MINPIIEKAKEVLKVEFEKKEKFITPSEIQEIILKYIPEVDYRGVRFIDDDIPVEIVDERIKVNYWIKGQPYLIVFYRQFYSQSVIVMHFEYCIESGRVI